jgi:phenylalanyl-tRNA synthetase beta subunit
MVTNDFKLIFYSWETSAKLVAIFVLVQIAMAGFTEVVTWILGSHHENFAMVNREDDGKTAVIVGNPRTSEFEVRESAWCKF